MAAQTEDANNRLVAMEKESFRQVRLNDKGRAWSILNGPAYRVQKTIYAGRKEVYKLRRQATQR